MKNLNLLGENASELDALKAKFAGLAKAYQTFLAESAQKAAAEFAPQQKAVAALMPKIAAANKGEKVDFAPEELAILKNAAVAGEKFEAMSVIFGDKVKAALATQINNAKLMQAAAAKYIQTTFYDPTSLRDLYNKVEAAYRTFYTNYASKFDAYQTQVDYKVATDVLLSFYEDAIKEANRIMTMINEHKKNHPSIWKADPHNAGLIQERQNTLESYLDIAERYSVRTKKGLIATESRFNSPLLNDRNANNLSGTADDYNDPEVIATHRRTNNNNSSNNNSLSDVLDREQDNPLSGVLDREQNKNSNNSNPAPEPNPQTHNEDIYHDFVDIPLIKDGMTSDDVVQGDIGNCYLMSTMASVANNPQFRDALSKNITQIHVNLYEVTLYVKTLDKDGKPTERLPKKIRVDTDFPVDAEGNILYAKIKGDIWAAIIEKAYAKEFGGYDDIHNGDTAINAMAALTNIEPKDFMVEFIQSNRKEHSDFINKMNSKKAVMTFITKQEGSDIKPSVLEALAKKGMTVELSHAYSFDSYSNGQIHLRNPHGENHLTITFDELYACFSKITYVSK